jgi:hypothetical protein
MTDRLLALQKGLRSRIEPLLAGWFSVRFTGHKSHATGCVGAPFSLRLRRLPRLVIVFSQYQVRARDLLSRTLEILDRLSVVRTLLMKEHS